MPTEEKPLVGTWMGVAKPDGIPAEYGFALKASGQGLRVANHEEDYPGSGFTWRVTIPGKIEFEFQREGAQPDWTSIGYELKGDDLVLDEAVFGVTHLTRINSASSKSKKG